MMAAALVAPQLLSRRPALGHSWIAFGLLGVIGVALFLSDSRGSMLGLATGLGVVALLRYRKLIWLLAAVVVLVLVLPVTQSYIDRMIAGFTGADLETQMRFGEYKDALRLIERYPVLGVGFAAPPDIDLYIGFASTYLTIAANAGIIGLIAYLITIGSVFVYGYLNRRPVTADHALNDIWFGLLGGIVGALAGGIFDHFYFNIEFQATSLTVWLFIGLFLAATRIANPPDVADRLVMPRLPAAQGGNL
jgi:O-antigen ligase